ncbi:hypothetical protein [Saccharopolyspora sp. CA-218241]|uniref:hypothetical protein n=1 Tax=Saccharopolyspora sp. CA-218241 TaxID=3240027 RepID=UPI003D9975E4
MADPHRPEPRPDSEIIDAEVVSEEVHAARGSTDADYQEFLEFQRFKEWKRGQAGEPPGAPPAPPPKRPWWRRALGLLRYKFVRRLLYLLLFLLVVRMLIGYLFGEDDDSGSDGGGPSGAAPVISTSPQQAVRGAYNLLRGDDPGAACALFADSGKQAFALAYDAPDCPGAARAVRAQITEPGAFANPDFAHDAVEVAGDEAAAYACRIRSTGGPQLGSFGLTRQPDGGWLISAYDMNAAECR